MSGVDIRDYIGHARELTAAEVRKLPAGSTVIRHSFDRLGNHQTLRMTVTTHVRHPALAYLDVDGMMVVNYVAKETGRMCYTEVGA